MKEKVTFKDLKNYFFEDFPLWGDSKQVFKNVKEYIERWANDEINEPILITKKLQNELTKDKDVIKAWEELEDEE